MVLGHLTVTAAGHRLLRRRVRSIAALPLGLLVLGAYLPDLADKSINLGFGISGRGYGHSVVMQSLIFAPALLLLRRRRLAVLALAIGASIHLLEDWVGSVVALAPLLGPIPMAPRWDWLQSLVFFYKSGGPLVWLEIAAALYWLGVGIRTWPRAARRTPSLAA